jgi:ABC-type Mn2+/Zn2+ transport system ATPase subunit
VASRGIEISYNTFISPHDFLDASTGIVNLVLLGYNRKEMVECYQNVLDFSELHDFINAIIRTYSSGIYARLGFAATTAHQPVILIVDEFLNAGDEAFQKMCRSLSSVSGKWNNLTDRFPLHRYGRSKLSESCLVTLWTNMTN